MASLKFNPVKPPVNTTEQPIITDEEIARRAHTLWMKKGCPVGIDQDIWFEAEKELKSPKDVQAV